MAVMNKNDISKSCEYAQTNCYTLLLCWNIKTAIDLQSGETVATICGKRPSENPKILLLLLQTRPNVKSSCRCKNKLHAIIISGIKIADGLEM